MNRSALFMAIAAFIVGGAVGYFVGREHVKAEIRSAFTEAGTVFKKAVGSGLEEIREGIQSVITGNTETERKQQGEGLAYVRKHVTMRIDAPDKDGWAKVSIKNTGFQTVEVIEMTVYFLDADGRPVSEQTARLLGFYGESPLRPNYEIDKSRHLLKPEQAPKSWAGKIETKVRDARLLDD